MSDLEIVRGYVPGSLGRVASLHGSHYHEHWGFDLYFEAKVATELAEFLLAFDPDRDGFWTVSEDGEVQAAVAIDGTRAAEEGAHLRWFIVSERMRGKGVGARLLATAVRFCRECGYPGIRLWTFAGLDAARRLYEREGFVLVEERPGAQWGTQVLEQHWVCELTSI